MKRFTALFLFFLMHVSMAACGKSKEELDKAREVDASGVKTIEDAVAIAPKYTDGTYELSIKADVSEGSAMGVNMDILVSGSKANLDMSVDSIKEDCSLKYNGKEFKMRGACIHHDNGIIGASTLPDAEEFRLRKMKEAGFNAIRSAHPPAGKALLRLCDKLGIMVMDEVADMWEEPKSE